MRLSRLSFYMAIFALLAFTSQSFAVVKVPCEQMVHPVITPAMVEAEDMDYSEVNTAEQSHARGCCSQEHCSQMNCVSASVAVVSAPAPFSVQFSQTFNMEYVASSFVTRRTGTSPAPRRPPRPRARCPRP